MKAGGILALDIATRTGWAYAPAEAVRPWPKTAMEWGAGASPAASVKIGAESFKALTPGRVVYTYRRWLLDMLLVHQPRFVVFEAALVNNHSGQKAASRLLYLCGATEDACYQRTVQCLQEHLSTIRKHFLGPNNKRRPRDDMKRVVMAECARRGLPTSDDNTADAIAVLDYAAVTLAAKFR